MEKLINYFLITITVVFSNIAYSACDTTTASDGVLVFGSDSATVEFTNLQNALDMARECEFQISSFTTQSSSAARTNGSEIVWNPDEENSPWKGGIEEIEVGDLIQFNNEGMWYQIKSVTSNTMLLRRKVNIISGDYSYKVTKSMQIDAKGGDYSISSILDFSDIHFLLLSTSGRGKATFHFNRRPDFSNAPNYGHLEIDNWKIINRLSSVLFLGDPVDTSTLDLEHDIDLTINNSLIVTASGPDAIKSNYHGHIVFKDSHFEAKADLVFLPYTNSFQNPRSVTIDNSVFITSARVDGGADVGNKKGILIRTREGGNYNITNSLFGLLKRPNGTSGAEFGIRITSDYNANITLDNVNVICNSCDGTVSKNQAPRAAILLEGSGGNFIISNSEIIVDPASCGIAAAFNAVVNTSNNTWTNSTPPYCLHEGGEIY